MLALEVDAGEQPSSFAWTLEVVLHWCVLQGWRPAFTGLACPKSGVARPLAAFYANLPIVAGAGPPSSLSARNSLV
jgi:hypothetical protein